MSNNNNNAQKKISYTAIRLAISSTLDSRHLELIASRMAVYEIFFWALLLLLDM